MYLVKGRVGVFEESIYSIVQVVAVSLGTSSQLQYAQMRSKTHTLSHLIATVRCSPAIATNSLTASALGSLDWAIVYVVDSYLSKYDAPAVRISVTLTVCTEL